MPKRVAVIGGGASGIMAAIFAAAAGSPVTLFEKQKTIGRKILVSGNGRCNITNRGIGLERYHGRNPRFVHNVFARFGLPETIDFFESIGLPMVEEKNGRMFPASLQAASVVRVLEYELARRQVQVRVHRKIERMTPAEGGFVLVTAGREEHRCDTVILAAGSCAFPTAGGSRSGYELARQAGHSVIEPFPAILPLTVPLKILHRLQGIKWDCAVRVQAEGKILATAEGEVLFTGYGLSGPASLDVSRALNDSIVSGGRPEIVLDLMPGMTEDRLGDLLDLLWSDRGKTAAFGLVGILKRPMPEVVLGLAGVEPGKKAGDVTGEEKCRVVRIMKALSLEPGPPRGFDEAVVAAGGVDVNEINPATMESRIMPGLHITGELLDIDGDSGGYNLQFAWSTGAIAGMSQGPVRST